MLKKWSYSHSIEQRNSRGFYKFNRVTIERLGAQTVPVASCGYPGRIGVVVAWWERRPYFFITRPRCPNQICLDHGVVARGFERSGEPHRTHQVTRTSRANDVNEVLWPRRSRDVRPHHDRSTLHARPHESEGGGQFPALGRCFYAHKLRGDEHPNIYLNTATDSRACLVPRAPVLRGPSFFHLPSTGPASPHRDLLVGSPVVGGRRKHAFAAVGVWGKVG